MSAWRTRRRAGGAPGPGAGFTLTEVLVAVLLGVMVIAGATTAYIQYRRMIISQQINAEVQATLRTAAMYLVRDLTMAGYGLDLTSVRLQQWITWVPNFTANPLVTQGSGSAADTITMAAAYDRLASLAAAVASGANTITLSSTDAAKFNTAEKRLIYIGGSELARITAINSGTLTISTHPTSARGLKYSYTAGAPVELVRAVTYSVDLTTAGSGLPYQFKREDYTSDTQYWYQNVLTAGIDDLQAERVGNVFTITLRARSTTVDPLYRDPATGSHFRRANLTLRVVPRNL